MSQIAVILPQLILAVVGLGLLATSRAKKQEEDTRNEGKASFVIALATLIGAAVAWFEVAAPAAAPFAAFLEADGVSAIGGHAIILGSAIFCVLCLASGGYKSEHAALLLFATAALLILILSRHLLVAYLALELSAMVLYLFAASAPNVRASVEAGLKYFVLGAVASALMLYGLSLIYGFGGDLSFETLGLQERGVAAGLVFFGVGLAFKLALAPFHMWAPDVYQGAPTAAVAFLSSVPKFAIFLFLLKLLGGELYQWRELWQLPLAILGGLSMVVGATAALAQTEIKRLLAYSSIAHVGFASVAVAAATERGFVAAIAYMAVYLFMNLGLFALVLCLRRRGEQLDSIEEFSGFAKTRPVLAAGGAILLLSMAGVPPLAGFFIKLSAFTAAVEAGLVPLVLLAAIMTVVGAFYYLRIVNLMYFAPPPAVAHDEYVPKSLALVTLVISAVMLLFFLAPQPLYELLGSATPTLLRVP